MTVRVDCELAEDASADILERRGGVAALTSAKRRKAAAIFFIFDKSAFGSERFSAPRLLSSSSVVSLVFSLDKRP
jgi:hypothetical protein